MKYCIFSLYLKDICELRVFISTLSRQINVLINIHIRDFSIRVDVDVWLPFKALTVTCDVLIRHWQCLKRMSHVAVHVLVVQIEKSILSGGGGHDVQTCVVEIGAYSAIYWLVTPPRFNVFLFLFLSFFCIVLYWTRKQLFVKLLPS